MSPTRTLRILLLLSRVPYPLEKGDKLRAYHHLRLLSQRHEVFVLALADEPVHPDAETRLKPYCSEFHVVRLTWISRLLNMAAASIKGIPYSSGYFFSQSAQREVDRIVATHRPDRIYCQLTRMSEYVLGTKDIPRTLDFQDAFSKAFERRVQREPWYLRWLFRHEQRRLERYEERMLAEFENCVIISKQDRDCIKGGARDRIVIVPNGVDFEAFQPRELVKHYDLLFTGNMAYPPNVESAEFLVTEILPRVWRRLPNVTLAIAGATPAARVLSLAGPKVRVTGWVEDISECYASARVFVAPMLISTGLQNKLLEAMSMCLPCVTSQLANNALGAAAGRDLLVCADADQYADAIVGLLEDPVMASRIAVSGSKYVRERYSWDGATQPLIKLIEDGER